MTYRRILTHLQQMTFENIMAKGEIAHNMKFLLFSLLKKSAFISGDFPYMTSAADLLQVGKGEYGHKKYVVEKLLFTP